MRKSLFGAALLAAALVAGPGVSPAEACPMCKLANETDDPKPRAYMYSILFMLSMPAAIFTTLGVSLYRINKKEVAALEEFE